MTTCVVSSESSYSRDSALLIIYLVGYLLRTIIPLARARTCAARARRRVWPCFAKRITVDPRSGSRSDSRCFGAVDKHGTPKLVLEHTICCLRDGERGDWRAREHYLQAIALSVAVGAPARARRVCVRPALLGTVRAEPSRPACGGRA